jgi:hypothetical protein
MFEIRFGVKFLGFRGNDQQIGNLTESDPQRHHLMPMSVIGPLTVKFDWQVWTGGEDKNKGKDDENKIA